jgi:excisionase family DNA binding protein
MFEINGVVLLTAPEVAKRLGMTERQVRRLAEDGAFVAYSTGRDWIIREDSLSNYTPSKRGRPRSSTAKARSGAMPELRKDRK